VAVDLRSEPYWQAVCALLCALAAAAVALWQIQRWSLPQGPAIWGACLGLALLSGWMGWRMAGAPVARLEWTGGEWRFRQPVQPSARDGLYAPAGMPGALVDADWGAGQACAPEVTIDLGTWMLLRLGVPGRSRWGLLSPDWVAVSQRRVGLPWHGLRVALYGAPHALPPA